MAFLEPLESRVLMSATPAQITAQVKLVQKDELKLKAAVSAITKLLTKDVGIMKTDLTKAGVIKSQAALAGEALAAAKGLNTSLTKDIKFNIPELTKETAKLVSDQKKLAKKPASASLQETIRTDYDVLGTISIDGDAPFTYGSKAPGVFNALNAIAAANPTSTKITADANSIKAGLTTAASKAETDSLALFDTDIANVDGLYLD